MQQSYLVNDRMPKGETNHHSFLGMTAVIQSAPMRQLMHKVEKIAKSNAAVLIIGETGSGKEVVARALHHHSLRCGKPWIDVNCAALPDHLLESELFGHEKGAFSGADSMKQGFFELANGGTLFLDEVGELDLKMQVKLLRVLDGTPYYRLGGTRKVTSDVRIVAATNVDLREAVEKGTFRRDLYHRLDQARLDVPALRLRADDIEPLAQYFLEKEASHLRFTPAALDALQSYSWPGNVRELRNVVVKAALLAEGDEIDLNDLPESLCEMESSRNLGGRTLDELEQRAIFDALSETGGRQDRAARMLGISQRTLIRKLKIYHGQEPASRMAAVAQ
ncbi:MAG TPA: sigma-54 dependent transcriptional regulator [Bryobacteraceae bacterium]|nr:sigma-54 dependent transcriptional regulator [Bryobacteraceae bacterium]